MNKTELVAAIAAESEMTKVDAAKALEATLKVVTDELAKGESITLIGFGTFKVSERKERMGRNPQTGKDMKIPARKVAAFTPGKLLKEAVNK